MLELSAMALPMSSRRSIISTTNACRAVMSKALKVPCTTLSAMSDQMLIVPVSASAASAPDWSRERICVPMSRRRLSARSTHTPATGERKKMGAWLAKPTIPNRNAELRR